MEPLQAVRFACVVADISVMRPGRAPGDAFNGGLAAALARGVDPLMLQEIEALLPKG